MLINEFQLNFRHHPILGSLAFPLPDLHRSSIEAVVPDTHASDGRDPELVLLSFIQVGYVRILVRHGQVDGLLPSSSRGSLFHLVTCKAI